MRYYDEKIGFWLNVEVVFADSTHAIIATAGQWRKEISITELRQIDDLAKAQRFAGMPQ